MRTTNTHKHTKKYTHSWRVNVHMNRMCIVRNSMAIQRLNEPIEGL